jgi:hypothetical protein
MSIVERSLSDPDPPILFMTEAEFEHWHEEGVRGEWVDGELQLMRPVSNVDVQLQMLLCNVMS